MFENIPHKLRDMPQWVCHRYPNKTPLCPRVGNDGELSVASCRNSLAWGNFIDAVQVVADGHALGIGFQLANGICGIDLDKCIENGQLSDFAQKVVNRLGSYAEISPSGTGVHILCRASMPLLKGFRDCVRGLDVSFCDRYFIVTGNALVDENGQPYPLEECSEQVGLLMTEEVDL